MPCVLNKIRPTVYVSMIKHEINKCVFADPRLWHYPSETHFLTRLCRRFQYYHLRCSDITTWLSSRQSEHVVNFFKLFTYIFFRRRIGYASFRLCIKFSAIPVYANTCACPDKSEQMCFGSVNYATCMYIK